MEEELDLRRVLVCETEIEAQVAKGYLEENGIKVMVRGLDAGGSVFGGAVDDPQIELFVSPESLEQATELIEALQAEQDVPIPAWICKCGEDVDEGFAVCWNCESDYQPAAESE